MRGYYVSLACQVDGARNDLSRKTPQVLTVRGLRNHTTIEISLSHAYGLRFGPGTYVDDKGSSEIVMSLQCSRLSETSFSILGRQYQGNALIEPIGAKGCSGWFVGNSEVIPTQNLARLHSSETT